MKEKDLTTCEDPVEVEKGCDNCDKMLPSIRVCTEGNNTLALCKHCISSGIFFPILRRDMKVETLIMVQD